MNLPNTCLNIYRNSICGNFLFQKSYRRFSKMNHHQVHRLNKEKIKVVSGATHLLNRNDMSGVDRWETSSPENARIAENFESNAEHDFDSKDKRHHEDTVAFQIRFFLYMKKFIEGMDVSLFLPDDLVKMSNVSQVDDHRVHLTLQTLLINAETQFAKFLKAQLIIRTTTIHDPIKKNNYKLPGNVNEKLNFQENKLEYLITTLTKLREAVRLRKDKTTKLL